MVGAEYQVEAAVGRLRVAPWRRDGGGVVGDVDTVDLRVVVLRPAGAVAPRRVRRVRVVRSCWMARTGDLQIFASRVLSDGISPHGFIETKGSPPLGLG